MATAAIKTPPLPPGFQLENQRNDELPPLPQGFHLESQLPEGAGKGAARAGLQIPLGIAEGTGLGLGGQLLNLAGAGESLAELEDLKERIPELKKKFPQLPWENFDENNFEQKYREALQTATNYNPLTVGGLGQITEDITGLPTGHPKTRGQELIRTGAAAGKFAPGKLLEKTIRGASVPAISKLLSSQGVPEGLADNIAFLLSQTPKGKGIKESKLELPKGKAKAFEPEFKLENEKYPSGLTKPRAAVEKRPELGIITPSQQEKAIGDLNKEAAKLTKEKFHESFPTAKKLEEGFNFDAAFNKGFGELEAQAAKANPHIDIAPFTKFLRSEAEKYRGIPTLDSEAKKIMKWIEDFRSEPQSGLKNLMRIYRSVNRELKRTFDKAKLSGVPNHYVNFLTRANKEISTAIRNTLPENSEWMRRFDLMNKVYKNFRDAEKVSSILRPLLQAEPTAANLRKFANDPKLQKALELRMGKDAAGEIIQIAKDLDAATKAINRLSAKTIKELDDIYPIPLLLAGMKIPGLGFAIKKSAEIARRIYGTNLTKPATRKVYREAVEAATKGDIPAYKKATDTLQKEQGLIGYNEPKLLEHKPKPKPSPIPKVKEIEKIANIKISKGQKQVNRKGSEILEKIFEINPSFELRQYLKEKPTFIRDIDFPNGSKSLLTKYYNDKEWNKYFNPQLYDKYYNKGKTISKNLGKIGDFIEDPWLRKKLQPILDYPIERGPLKNAWGQYDASFSRSTGKHVNKKIIVKPNMSPQKLHSTIMHEALHGLQAEIPRKGSIYSRSGERYFTEKNIPYTSKLSEVKARQFQDWIDKPVNQYRTKVEKTKEARRLWEEQISLKNKPKEDTRNFFVHYYKLNDKGRKLFNEWAEKYGNTKSYNEQIEKIEELVKTYPK